MANAVVLGPNALRDQILELIRDIDSRPIFDGASNEEVRQFTTVLHCAVKARELNLTPMAFSLGVISRGRDVPVFACLLNLFIAIEAYRCGDYALCTLTNQNTMSLLEFLYKPKQPKGGTN